MLRTLLIILILCISIPWVLAQNPNDVREKHVYNRVQGMEEWSNFSRTIYRNFDQFHRESTLYLRINDAWKSKSKDIYLYNKADKLISHESLIYNESDEGILLRSLEENTYINDTLITSRIFVRQIFEETISTFQSEMRLEYTSELKIQSEISRFRESLSGPWNDSKRTYEYDIHGCRISTLFEERKNDEPWEFIRQEIFERDDLCRETLFSRIENVNGDLKETYGRYSTYEESPNLIRISRYQRLRQGGAWQLIFEQTTDKLKDSTIITNISDRQTFTIRETTILLKNRLLSETSEITAGSNNEFIIVGIKNYFYVNENLIKIEWEERDADAPNTVRNKGTNLFVYDDKGNQIEKSQVSEINGMTFFYGENLTYRCDGQLNSIKTQTINSSEQQEVLTTYAYYSDPPCGSSDFENSLTLFPNPAREDIWIYSKNDLENAIFQIIDLSGKLVSQKKAFGKAYASLDVSDLMPGVYVLKVTGLNYIESARFVKYE